MKRELISINLDRFVNINGHIQKAAGYFFSKARDAGLNIIEYGKPNPDISLKACELATYSQDEAYMVGDSLDIDILGGKHLKLSQD